MSLLKKWESKDALFGIWHVTETQERLKFLLNDIPYIDDELKTFKSDSRRMEYLAVRVLLKEMTGRMYRIMHHASGKPYIEGENIKISISHTKNYVAIGLHKDKEVGVDIEFFSDRVKKVSSKFVDEIEENFVYEYEKMCSDSLFAYILLLVWSGKETLYKIIDFKEVDFKKHLRVFPFGVKIYDTCSFISDGKMLAQEYKSDLNKTFDIDYMLHRDFVFTYCISG